MPFVPMPGSAPRGWSFRHASNRSLGLNSTTHEESQVSEMPVELESVAELPSESNHYDTPYREDFTETKNQPKSLRQSRSKQHQKPKKRVQSKPAVFDGPSGKDDSGNSTTTSLGDPSFAESVRQSTTSSTLQRKPFVSDQPSIALFGASGITGGHFLTAALDAGYSVRCLPADDPREMGSFVDWDAIKFGLEDSEQLQSAVYCVDYVVIMLNDVIPGKNDYPAGFLASFIEKLYAVLRDEASVQVVLFQATSLAIDVKGKIPIMSKVIKSVAHRRNTFLQDQDAAIHRIGVEHGIRTHNDENRSVNMAPPHFRFIVTRPSVLLQDGASSKKLAASKSQPGPFPVTHIDLADFSLSALSKEKMYDSSPYVVAYSF